MFFLKNTITYTLALVFFALSYVEYTIVNTANTGIVSLWALVWQNTSLVMGIITGSYLYLLVHGRLKQAEGDTSFGAFSVTKTGYMIAMMIFAGYQTIKHIFHNTFGHGLYSLFHLIMLVLSAAVTILAATELRGMLQNSATNPANP